MSATITVIKVPASVVRILTSAWANVKSAAKGFEIAVGSAAEARPEDVSVSEWKLAVNKAFYKAEGVKSTKTARGKIMKVQLSQAWSAVLGSGSHKPKARALRPDESVLRDLFSLSPTQQANVAVFFGVSDKNGRAL